VRGSKGEGTLFVRPMEYVRIFFYKLHLISVFAITTNTNIKFKNRSFEIHNDIIFKSNTMIRILAIELSNTILILYLNDKISF
jgi:hypothetical protein